MSLIREPGAVEMRPATSDEAEAMRIHAVGRREILIAWGLLLLLGALSFGPHAIDGGFTFDDWSNGSNALQRDGLGAVLDHYVELTAYRPVLVLYVPLTYEIFGMQMAWHLAWAGGIAIAVSCLLFGILRSCGLARPHAWLIAALVLLLPWLDSTRMWATASQVTLGVAFALAGIWLALIGLRRGSWRLHVAALVLYALSILTYEVALPLIAAAGLLYVGLTGWRKARSRWAADLGLVAVAVIWVWSQTERQSGGMSDYLDHLWRIVVAGGTLLGRTGLPLGPRKTTLVLVVLGCIAAVALAMWLRDRRRRQPGDVTPMAQWLLLGAAGLAVAALGWIMFVPADPYYTPSVYGVTNRVNGLAGIGLVLVVYATCGVLGTLTGRLASRPKAVATWTTAVLAICLGFAYKTVLERHADIWITAHQTQMDVLDKIRATVPRPPDGTTIFAAGHPLNQTLGVPIFSSRWDLNGAVRLHYRNRTLRALPIFYETRIDCGRDGLRLVGENYASWVALYGRALLIDVPSGGWTMPRNLADCRRRAPNYVSGPLYLSLTY